MPIPELPLLKPWLRLVGGESQVVFEHAHTSWVLEGAGATVLMPVLVPLLDGTRTVPEIISAVGEDFAPAVENALSILAGHWLLTDGPPLPDETPATLAETVWQLASTDSSPTRSPFEILSNLTAAAVHVVGSARVSSMIVDLLRDSGVKGVAHEPSITFADAECNLLIATPSAEELPQLAELNQAALDQAVAWLPVLPFDGRFAGIGPLIVPWETCCYSCYLARRAAASHYADTSGMPELIPASLPTGPIVYGALASLAAIVAIRWLGLSDPFLPGRLHTFEFHDALQLRVHDVLRVPRCEACSLAARTPMPFPWHEPTAAPRSELPSRG